MKVIDTGTRSDSSVCIRIVVVVALLKVPSRHPLAPSMVSRGRHGPHNRACALVTSTIVVVASVNVVTAMLVRLHRCCVLRVTPPTCL